MRTTPPVAVIVLCIIGCNEIGGINEPIPRGATTSPPGTAVVDAGAASGDPKLSAFLGAWSSKNGVLTVKCPGEPAQSGTVGNDIVLAAGTSSDLVLTDPECALKLNVKGNTATFVSGQTCTVTDDQETDEYFLAGGSFVLGGSSGTATLTLAGEVKITTPTASATCDFERTDPYVRQ